MRSRVIILDPSFCQTRQLHLTRPVLALLGTLLFASMCAALAFYFTFPVAIDDFEFNRMKAENVALRLEHETADTEAKRLTAQIAKMEKVSTRISRDLAAD